MTQFNEGKPQQIGQLQSQLERMESLSSACVEMVQAVANRLTSVMRPMEQPSAPSTTLEKVQAPSLVPAALQLRRSIVKIESAISELQGFLDRLEV